MSLRSARVVAVLSVAAVLTVGALFGACKTAPFRDHGPRERSGAPGLYADETPIEGRGFPRPILQIEPPDALTGGIQHLTVRRQIGLAGGMWRLELNARAPDGGPDVDPKARPVAVVKYRMGADLQLPLVAGEAVAVRLTQTTRGTGLVVWDDAGANGALVAALAIGIDSSRELGAEAIGDLGPEPDFDVSHLAYSEVKLGAAGCAEATEHYDLKVRVGDTAAWLPPGAMRRVTVRGAEFDLVALDASRPDPRFAPPTAECPSPAHVSWVLLRAAPRP